MTSIRACRMPSWPLLRAGLVLLATTMLLQAQNASRPAASSATLAANLFGELGKRAGAQPLYVVADLDITRGGTTRSLVLRVHLRGPGHILVQVHEPPRADGTRGAPREDGTVLLLHAGRLMVWFPHAELVLAVPEMLAGTRLCGSDLALDHLMALAGDGSRWHAVDVTDASFDGEPCQRLLLHPGTLDAGPTDTVPDTSFAAMELLLTHDTTGAPLPRQLDCFDAAGVLVSRVRLDAARRSTARRLPTRGAGMPDAWTAWTLPPRDAAPDDVTTLRVTFSERDPPIAPGLFLPDALTAWR